MIPVPVGQVSRSFWWVQSFRGSESIKGEKGQVDSPVREQTGTKRQSHHASWTVSSSLLGPITVVRVQLKAANSEVLILAHKEDKDK